MATSFQFPHEDHNHHHQIQMTKPAVETMSLQNGASTGRRRSSKNGQNNKKKKQPQRGMGVEQLERLRMQDQIKNSNIHAGNHQYYSNNNNNNNNFPNFTTLSSFTGTASACVAPSAAADHGIYNSILNSSPVLQFPKLCVSPNDFFVQQKVVNTGPIGSSSNSVVAFGDQLQSQMGLYGFASSKPRTEKPQELSSMPNLFNNSNNNSCFSDRCRSCNKKKRMINGEEIMNIHMEDMIREKEDSRTKPLLHPYSIPSRLEKGVEIMAIHRKGNSSVSSSEEGAVVMEYDFFPEKNGTNTSCFGKMMMMSTTNNSSESSSVATAMGNINGEASSVTTISWADTTPTSSIDLSLKLSC